MTHLKSLTPAQQNWAPLIQEAYALLEVKRATRQVFGTIRTLCWTDHANLTRAQSSDIGSDQKLVRWVAEILMDGSEIRSLKAVPPQFAPTAAIRACSDILAGWMSGQLHLLQGVPEEWAECWLALLPKVSCPTMPKQLQDLQSRQGVLTPVHCRNAFGRM